MTNLFKLALIILAATAPADTVLLTHQSADGGVVIIRVDRQTAAHWRDDVTKPADLRTAATLALGGLPVQTVIARTDDDRRREHAARSAEPHSGAHVQRLHVKGKP